MIDATAQLDLPYANLPEAITLLYTFNELEGTTYNI